MVFNSLQFLVFFLVVTLWFYRMKDQRQRRWLLLTASCFFYMCFVPAFILILAATIIIDYIAAIQINKYSGGKRRAWLIASIIANVGILAYFKYFNFFIENIQQLYSLLHMPNNLHLFDIILPLGLSFHTFQAMSYTIEVYRGNQPPERNFVVYALYVMFYPQLVAGPIERPQNVLPQLHTYTPYNWDNIKEGLARMLWGFFKKCVIADRLAMVVDNCFSSYHYLSGWVLFVGAVFYAFQIYCDFSGYSDIALGTAKVMGVKLMTNFDEPLLSKNISDFWRRWHISLSTWFNDYIYFPIAASLRNMGAAAIYIGLFVTFFFSGFWHGAGWNYILFALIHGFAIMFEIKFKKQRKKLFSRLPPLVSDFLSHFITFSFLVFVWVFFRATSMDHALGYLAHIFSSNGGGTEFGLKTPEILFSLLMIAMMLWRERKIPYHFIQSNRKFALYVTSMMVFCYYFGVFGENQFIYFQF